MIDIYYLCPRCGDLKGRASAFSTDLCTFNTGVTPTLLHLLPSFPSSYPCYPHFFIYIFTPYFPYSSPYERLIFLFL